MFSITYTFIEQLPLPDRLIRRSFLLKILFATENLLTEFENVNVYELFTFKRKSYSPVLLKIIKSLIPWHLHVIPKQNREKNKKLNSYLTKM